MSAEKPAVPVSWRASHRARARESQPAAQTKHADILAQKQNVTPAAVEVPRYILRNRKPIFVKGQRGKCKCSLADVGRILARAENARWLTHDYLQSSLLLKRWLTDTCPAQVSASEARLR